MTSWRSCTRGWSRRMRRLPIAAGRMWGRPTARTSLTFRRITNTATSSSCSCVRPRHGRSMQPWCANRSLTKSEASTRVSQPAWTTTSGCASARPVRSCASPRCWPITAFIQVDRSRPSSGGRPRTCGSSRRSSSLPRHTLLPRFSRQRLEELIDGALLRRGYDCYWRRDLVSARRIFRRSLRAGGWKLKDLKYLLPALLPEGSYLSLIGRADGRATRKPESLRNGDVQGPVDESRDPVAVAPRVGALGGILLPRPQARPLPLAAFRRSA